MGGVVERCGIRRPFGLGSLTHVTSHDIASDVLAHPRSEIVPGDELQGLVVPWMSHCRVIVVCVNDLSA